MSQRDDEPCIAYCHGNMPQRNEYCHGNMPQRSDEPFIAMQGRGLIKRGH
jgi:hypothetical protein